jgi:hypothetical protein
MTELGRRLADQVAGRAGLLRLPGLIGRAGRWQQS